MMGSLVHRVSLPLVGIRTRVGIGGRTTEMDQPSRVMLEEIIESCSATGSGDESNRKVSMNVQVRV